MAKINKKFYNTTKYRSVVGSVTANDDLLTQDLSAVGNIYVHGTVDGRDVAADGIKVTSVYSYVDDTSGNWNEAYTVAGTNSADIVNVKSASGDWNEAYTNVSTSTGDWNAVQPLVHPLPRGSWVIDNTPGTFSTFSSTVSAASGSQTQPITITADEALVDGNVTLTFNGAQTVTSVVATHNSSNDPDLTISAGGDQVPSIDPSGNIVLAGGESQRNFLSMQQDNFGGDHPYSTLNYGHAYILPYYTTVKKVIIRASKDALSANIGIHTNEDETTGKNKKFFSETPIASTDNYLTANESKVYTFTSDTTANEGSTLGVSISSTDRLNAVNATVVLEYDTTI